MPTTLSHAPAPAVLGLMSQPSPAQLVSGSRSGTLGSSPRTYGHVGVLPEQRVCRRDRMRQRMSGGVRDEAIRNVLAQRPVWDLPVDAVHSGDRHGRPGRLAASRPSHKTSALACLAPSSTTVSGGPEPITSQPWCREAPGHNRGVHGPDLQTGPRRFHSLSCQSQRQPHLHRIRRPIRDQSAREPPAPPRQRSPLRPGGSRAPNDAHVEYPRYRTPVRAAAFQRLTLQMNRAFRVLRRQARHSLPGTPD